MKKGRNNKKKSPPCEKYEKENPTVSARVPKETRDSFECKQKGVTPPWILLSQKSRIVAVSTTIGKKKSISLAVRLLSSLLCWFRLTRRENSFLLETSKHFSYERSYALFKGMAGQ